MEPNCQLLNRHEHTQGLLIYTSDLNLCTMFS